MIFKYIYLNLQIVDDGGNVVPFGTAGELLTRGYSTMMEYWGDDNKTADIITDDGWLRSGFVI